MALFNICYCFCCGAEMPVPKGHEDGYACQVECNTFTTPRVHKDFCEKCQCNAILQAIEDVSRGDQC